MGNLSVPNVPVIQRFHCTCISPSKKEHVGNNANLYIYLMFMWLYTCNYMWIVNVHLILLYRLWKVFVAILSTLRMTQLVLWIRRFHWETLSLSPSPLTEGVIFKSAMQLEPGFYLMLTSVRYIHVHFTWAFHFACTYSVPFPFDNILVIDVPFLQQHMTFRVPELM